MVLVLLSVPREHNFFRAYSSNDTLMINPKCLMH